MSDLYASPKEIYHVIYAPRLVKKIGISAYEEIVIRRAFFSAINRIKDEVDVSAERARALVEHMIFEEERSDFLFYEEDLDEMIDAYIDLKERDESTEDIKSISEPTSVPTSKPTTGPTVSDKIIDNNNNTSTKKAIKPPISLNTSIEAAISAISSTKQSIVSSILASIATTITSMECDLNTINYNKQFQYESLQKEYDKIKQLNEVNTKKLQEKIKKMQLKLYNNNNNSSFDGNIIDEDIPIDLSMDILFKNKLQSLESEINLINNQILTDKNDYDEAKQQYDEQKLLIIKAENEYKTILKLEESSKLSLKLKDAESAEILLSSNGKICGADLGGIEYGDFRNNKTTLNITFCGDIPGGGDYGDIRNKNKLCKASLNGELIGAELGGGDYGSNGNKVNVLNISSNGKNCSDDPGGGDNEGFRNENKLFIASSNGECIGADLRSGYYAEIRNICIEPTTTKDTANVIISNGVDSGIGKFGKFMNKENKENILYALTDDKNVGADPGGGDLGDFGFIKNKYYVLANDKNAGTDPGGGDSGDVRNIKNKYYTSSDGRNVVCIKLKDVSLDFVIQSIRSKIPPTAPGQITRYYIESSVNNNMESTLPNGKNVSIDLGRGVFGDFNNKNKILKATPNVKCYGADRGGVDYGRLKIINNNNIICIYDIDPGGGGFGIFMNKENIYYYVSSISNIGGYDPGGGDFREVKFLNIKQYQLDNIIFSIYNELNIRYIEANVVSLDPVILSLRSNIPSAAPGQNVRYQMVLLVKNIFNQNVVFRNVLNGVGSNRRVRLSGYGGEGGDGVGDGRKEMFGKGEEGEVVEQEEKIFKKNIIKIIIFICF